VVVELGPSDIPTLGKALTKAGLRVQAGKLRDAWKSEYRIATVQDGKTPHTLDILFSDQKLDLRPGRILGIPTYYQSPESLILAKLRMIKVTVNQARAATDREDVMALLRAAAVNLRMLRRRAIEERTIRILEGLLNQ